MIEREKKTCSGRATITTTIVWSLFIGAMLYTIIATPDAGGIWDGYVPTWLGGEGPAQ